MAVFAYNIVILEYSDLIFLDLKQKATVLFSPFSIVMWEIIGTDDDLKISAAIKIYLNSDFYSEHPSFIFLSEK